MMKKIVSLIVLCASTLFATQDPVPIITHAFNRPNVIEIQAKTFYKIPIA